MNEGPHGVSRIGSGSVPAVEEYRQEVPESIESAYDYLISRNCRPSIAAASTLYVYGYYNNQRTPQSALAEYFDTTTTSISKWYNELWDNRNEWEIEQHRWPSKVLKELRKVGEGGSEETEPTKKDLLREINKYLKPGVENPYPSLDADVFEELTGVRGDSVEDGLAKKEVLEDEFGLSFGNGEDATVHVTINLNKSGVEKIHQKLKSNRDVD